MAGLLERQRDLAARVAEDRALYTVWARSTTLFGHSMAEKRRGA
jgi:hypothetical protein